MAEKKFFVDINLQGSALTNAKIGTNTGIGSTEGAFGYDSTAHRLQYFDGTATKEVANLSDIAAVTGGLILQGGYDAATDTPNITDGSAFKGFFWVVTETGTFLGESVQVGDSIIAKVDEAGATLSDWLILQGNIVIATDSVDGISRLATQTEANDGTESGAVVITPATLQGKLDAQITPEINSKVSKSGDTMSGNLDMGGNDINNIDNTRTSKLNVDEINSFTNFGKIDIHLPVIYGGELGDNFDAKGNQIRNLGLLSGNQGNSGDQLPINNPKIQGTLDADNNPVINLPAPTNDGDATNKLYVDNASNDKLPLAGGTMSGSINMNGSQLQNSLLADATLDSNLDANGLNITNLATPTNGGDATNKTYVDGQVATALPLAGGTMTGNIDFLGPHGITNLNAIQVDNLSATDPSYNIVVYNNLDLQSGATLTNVPAPTNGGDATNKEYVDNAASTAESNANAYTDARSTAEFVATGDWVDGGGFYYAEVAHGISGNVMITLLYNDRPAEFDFEQLGGSITLYSNILPTATTQVNVMKVS